MRGKTFIITGPSGVGKGTIIKELFQRQKNLYFSVSATTREPRPGEVDGTHYHFLTKETFLAWIADNAFLEHAEYVGNHYGTPKKYVDEAMERGEDVILDIEVQGADQVYENRPETVRIFIIPPSWEELRRRLLGRGTEDAAKVQSRLLRAKEELSYAQHYDYIVVNDSLEKAVEEIQAIIKAEHCRLSEQKELLASIC